MSVQTLLNTIRANASELYQERIPEATRTNLTEIGTAITNFTATRNEFLSELINRIAFVEVSNRKFNNPLAVLKKGKVVYGSIIEDVYVNPVAARKYEGTEIGDMLEITKPDIKTIYYIRNREDKYPVSITLPELQKAFTSENEFSSFVRGIITAMYAGDEMDEYLLMRGLISQAIQEDKLQTMEIDYTGDESTSKDLIKLINTLSMNFAFPSTAYNGFNYLNEANITTGKIVPCKTWCPQSEQIILIRNDVSASTSVEVLAKAFNMDQATFMPRMIHVDDFGDSDTLAVICDEAFFKVWDNYYSVEDFYNGSNLVTNYWLHHHQTIQASLFANAVAIKQKATA